jgi:DNA-binding SARP family transcriptional activator/class 3 adenylate cyclase
MEFRILGPLEIVDGERSVRLGSAKQRTLLAALLVHAGEVVSSDRLIDVLWGDSPPPTAAGTLQGYVSRLRHALIPADRSEPETELASQAPGYVLQVPAGQIDADRFEALVAEARGESDPEGALARLDAALALWRGPALAEFADTEFARAEATRLEGIRLAAAGDRADLALDLGRHAELIGELEATVAASPLQERPRAQLMLALYRSGRQVEALRVFQDYRRYLADEMGLEPSAALQELEASMVRQDRELDLVPAATASAPVAEPPARIAPPPAPAPAREAGRGAEDLLDAGRTPPARATRSTVALPEGGTSLVGRRTELGWLRNRLEIAAHGRAEMILLDGEAGVGKTRVAQEVLDEAERAGMTVFTGRCYEQLDLAFLPLRESLLRAVIGSLAARAECAAELELATRIVDTPRDRDPGTDDRERTRQLLAVTRLIVEYARMKPTALLIDDLDWADNDTIDLLRHLLFRLEGEDAPLLVLATSRGDGSARAAAGIDRLRREPRCATLSVGPLAEFEAAELARQHGVTSPTAAREIAGASRGNPLVVEVLARQRAAGAASSAVPGGASTTMTAIVASDLDALSPAARGVVQMAAFLVPYCTRSAVAAVTGLSAPELDHALQEASERGVLAGGGHDIAFRQALYAHAAYATTPEVSRASIHRKLADALLAARERGEPVPLRAVAHHLVAADGRAESGLVIEYATRAGDEAIAAASWDEGARYYEAALARIEPEQDPAAALSLHRRAGLCRRNALELDRAVEHFDAAIALGAKSGDDETVTELYIWRMRCAIVGQQLLDPVAERDAFEQLVERAVDSAPALAADGLVEVSQTYWAEGQWQKAEDAARRAMEIADREGHATAYARATVTLSVPQWIRYDLEGSRASLEEGLARARAAENASALTGPLFRLPLVLTWLGRFAEAEALADEACDVAEQLNYPLEEGLPLAALTQIACARGDFDAVDRHAHQALLIQRLSGYSWAAGLFLPPLMWAGVARGRYETARDALDEWAGIAGPMEEVGMAVYRRYVDAMEGRSHEDGDRLPPLPREPMIGADSSAVAMLEIARREATRVDVQRAYDLLAEIDRRGGVMAGTFSGLVARSLGVAADLLGNEGEAITTLERAVSLGRALGAEPERARAEVDLAAILLRRGERDRAQVLLDDAGSTFGRLGMGPDEDRAATLAGGGATAPRGHATASATARTAVILFADVVDSTRLTEELGDVRYRQRAKTLEEQVNATIVAHEGTVVPGVNLGDGFIGLFASVQRALAASRRCARESDVTGLHLHLGVHSGEILVEGPRIFGGAVNRAARICGLSGPDEILVSETIREQARASGEVAFVDRGEHQLKGIAEPQRLYAVVEAEAANSPID